VRSLALAAIIAANLIGGLTYLLQDLALDGLPFGTITLGRNLIAMAAMLVWLGPRNITWRYPRADLLRLLLLAVVAYALPLLLGTVGTQLSTAANGSILILVEPCAILLFARLLLGEAVRPLQFAGIGVGLLGALVIVLRDAPPDGLLVEEHLRGNLLLALHAVLWGLYSPLMRPLVQRHRAMDVTFMSMLLAQVLLLPAALAEVPQWSAGPALLPALGWLLVLGLLGSFGGTVLWTWSLRTLPAAAVAPFVFLQPLAGVAGDALFRGRAVSPQAVLGGLFIAAGVLLVMWPARRARPAS